MGYIGRHFSVFTCALEACVSSRHGAEGQCWPLRGSHEAATLGRSFRSGTATAHPEGSLWKRCELRAWGRCFSALFSGQSCFGSGTRLLFGVHETSVIALPF